MKTLSCRFASFVFGFSLFFSASQAARANVIVESTSSFGDVSILSSGGTVNMGGLQSSSFAQAGANAQYNSSFATSVAGAMDVPVPGGSATGSGTASATALTGSSSAMASISGNTPGFDTSTGRASANGFFDVTGVSGPVNVTFSAVINGGLSLSSDAYGVYGLGETDFSLSVNGNAVLFSDMILTIGPSQSQSGTVSETLTGTMTLQANTEYDLWLEADSETSVVNSGELGSPVPDQGLMMAEGLAALALARFFQRKRQVSKAAQRRWWLLLGGAMAGWSMPAHATYLGSDAPDVCRFCGFPPTRQLAGTVSTSLSEGNIREDYHVVNVQSAFGPTLPLALTYNSYSADGSKVQLDTGLGFGWTHTYNALLFQQRGQMFRLGADGRVTQYYMNYSGTAGTYTSAAGYFETLTMQPDGSFMVTNKYQSWWHFKMVPGSTLLVAGPVYQLIQMGDRNQNLTTMSYNAVGRIASVTDTYGRALNFTYDAANHLSSVTDPLGRTTTFQYDALDRMPVQLTDPLGNTTTYTYNAQYQMTRKVDRDGRMYFYTYKSLRPFMVTDGSGQPYFSMSNPTNWAYNQTNLTFSLMRQYIPSTTSSTDGRGNVWQYSYDANGYITQTIAPDGATIRYNYDPGTLRVSSVTDANGHATLYQYDADGNRLQMTDALGDVTTWTYDPLFNQVTSMTDPNGRVTTNNYDPHGNRIQMTDPLGQMQFWTYDTHGNVLSMTDKRGYTSQNQYDGNGNLAQTIDALGDKTTYTYDAVGNRLSVTDANGHTTTYNYDSLDRLIQTTDPVGHTTMTTYDGAGNVLSRTDADNHATFYYDDLRSRLIATTNALGGVSQMAYDPNNNIIRLTDENGYSTTNTYDLQNRLITTTDPLGNLSSTSYDPVGNVLSTTDANNHTTTYHYDPLDRRISLTDALGHATTYEYANPGGSPCCGATSGSDLITGIIDGDGKIIYYNYDELNRRYQEVHKSGSSTTNITPLDAVTTTTYDADNDRIAITDPNGNTTRYTYDALDRQIGATNAAGNVNTTAYDPVGNVIQTVDPRGNVTTTTYDDDNRRIQTTDSIGVVLRTEYDGVGNVIATTNGNGNVTTTMCDSLNRVIETIDPLGSPTTTAYDADGNILSRTDRDGNTTHYTYDADDRRISTIDALGDTSTTAYDPVGNVLSTTDPLSHTTIYMYDALNRRIEEIYPDTPSDTRTYTYDALGHTTSRLDQNGHTTLYQYNDFYDLTNREYSTGPSDLFIYDLGGRVTNATRNGWTDLYIYDGADRVLTNIQSGQAIIYNYMIPDGIQSITYPDGIAITDAYDARSRLIEVNDGGSPLLTQYTYDLDDNVLTRANRNGTTAYDACNANDWVTNLTYSNTSGLFAGFAYTYDRDGNKLYQNNLTAPGDSETYSYDALDRLTNFDVGTLSGGMIPAPSTAESYNLDAVGNWIIYTSNSVPQTRAHSAVNELLTINGNPLLYDANGNLTNDGQYAYAYDVENRLITVTRDSGDALVGQYFYDALGRRITTVASPEGTSTTNVTFYDGLRNIEEQDAAGATQATYTYGNYLDETLTMERGTHTYYYHPNPLFSVEAVTDSSGAVAERYTYDAYGEPTVLDGSYNPLPLNAWGTPHSVITNEYLFTGRPLDEESGLYYNRARYYDAFKGRFLERDPLDSVKTRNLYEYVNDRPTFASNPTGREGAPPMSQVSTDWTRRRGSFESIVRIGSLCYKVRVNIEWQEQRVWRDGVEYIQWQNLRYLTFQRDRQMPASCAGQGVGELAPNGQWRTWSPPWPPAGEERREPAGGVFEQPPSSGLGETSPAGTETAPPSYAPQMLGD